MNTAPSLAYGHVFDHREAEQARACLAEHGFAVLKNVLTEELIQGLRRDVAKERDAGDLPEGGSRYCMDFVERSPAFWDLLRHRPYLDAYRTILGTDDICLHRSAAIARRAGSAIGWHTDSCAWERIDCANAVLNRWDDFPAGMWFYLNGSHPDRGGLAVIANSHRADWQPPTGFALTHLRAQIVAVDGSPAGMDVPGMVPLIGSPGDAVIFAARTYHASFTHRGDEVRLTCATILRQRRIIVDPPWGLPEHARRFDETAPAHVRPFLDGYPGIVPSWSPAGAQSAQPA